ncbi:hypothetical protein R3P38DRAFT_2837172 [Favolaschia claudopus]|uniref:Uncharacterized protein n=1 Tax=Favolaschia claudopus TaxID=2862362 RepID=A0AAW0E6X2_9AGAR
MATENIPEPGHSRGTLLCGFGNFVIHVSLQVTPDITIFSKPFTRYIFPFGGRSTAIRTSTGVWVLASTPLTHDTKAAIDKLGPVKWIVGADAVHHLFLAQYKEAYPDAKVIGVQALVEKKKSEGFKFDGAYGSDAPDTKYGFEDEVRRINASHYFSAFRNKDVAFFHVASKTLIVADLLFNLPANEQYSKSKSSAKVPILGKLDPSTSLHKKFVWSANSDRATMGRDAKTVLGWGMERAIMCHGDVIETGADKAWEAAYSKYFE